MPLGRRIIFTGISGVNVEGSIKKFIDFTQKSGHSISYYCINDYIHSIEKENKPNITWLELLTYPYAILIDLWNQALNKIISEINAENNPNKNYILVIHSCYYHQFTQEFISFVNVNFLGEFQAEKIITLIDDVDDIHARLKLEKRIFSKELGGASEDDIENIFELLKIIDWRANEILLSRFYANQLSKDDKTIKHYLFAVKHPIATLFKLIFEEDKYKKIYLSHPISKIRSLLFNKDFSEADKQTVPITHITKYLSERSICFFPTTIDEYRLDADKNPIIHSKRWEETFYEADNNALLYVSPGTKNFLPYNEIQLEKIFNEDSDRTIQLRYLLAYYLKDVTKQIGIRDKILVEQSDAIFVSRPYLNGRISDGVKTEIEYITRLYSEKDKKLGIVYFPEEDKNDTKVYQIKEGLTTFLYSSKVFTLNSENEEKCKKIIVDEFYSHVVSGFNQANTLVHVLQEIVKRLLELRLVSRNSKYQEKALDSQTSFTLLKKYEEFANKLKNAYDELLSKLESSFYVFEDEYQTQEIIQKFLTT